VKGWINPALCRFLGYYAVQQSDTMSGRMQFRK
jgi:hypothetical protein